MRSTRRVLMYALFGLYVFAGSPCFCGPREDRLSWDRTAPMNLAAGREETRRLSIFYVDFRISTYLPVTPENIKEPGSHIEVSDPRNSDYILDQVRERSGKAKFDKDRTRLLIVQESGDTILVDQEGTVKVGKQEYGIKPLAFLNLYTLLERLRAEQVDTATAR